MSEGTDERTTAGDDGGADTHQTQVTQRRYDPEGPEELTATIVYAIAAAEGVPPSEVKSPPLYNSVDVPAIEDAFFGTTGTETSRQGVGTVEFWYTDYRVKVRSDGWVQIYEPTETEPS